MPLHCSQVPQSKFVKHARRDEELPQVGSLRQRPLTQSSQLPQSKSLKQARREDEDDLLEDDLLELDGFKQPGIAEQRLLEHCSQVPQSKLLKQGRDELCALETLEDDLLESSSSELLELLREEDEDEDEREEEDEDDERELTLEFVWHLSSHFSFAVL